MVTVWKYDIEFFFNFSVWQKVLQMLFSPPFSLPSTSLCTFFITIVTEISLLSLFGFFWIFTYNLKADHVRTQLLEYHTIWQFNFPFSNCMDFRFGKVLVKYLKLLFPLNPQNSYIVILTDLKIDAILILWN